ERLVALAVLMPIVASMGGNAGTQTLTVVIRGLGTGIISGANAWKVVRKEFLVGSLNGIIWALAVALVAIVWYQDLALGGVVALAIFVNLVSAALAGVVLPLALQKAGIDPALAGGVALTTVTDVVGFFAVLGLAALFLM
ncbi:MAG TPA: magnesium transporter, partial [Arenicellales bacterium]|nr:magnesium transporter [Arenicellales bacterium]